MRRIVTGHNEEGKSVITIDGPPARSIGEDVGGLFELWNTDGQDIISYYTGSNVEFFFFGWKRMLDLNNQCSQQAELTQERKGGVKKGSQAQRALARAGPLVVDGG